MRALVVFESMFGNTERVARAVADGLAEAAQVEVVEVGLAPPTVTHDIDLLVVGGPTHAFSMSRVGTRASAARQADGPLVSSGIGIREWIESLPATASNQAVAAFDTRIRHPHVPGSAAKAVQRRFRRLGWSIAAPAKSFWVDGTTGPLFDGELERARQWGADLSRSMSFARLAG